MDHAENQSALASTHRPIARRIVANRRRGRWLLAMPLVASLVAVSLLVCAAVPSAVLGCHNVIALSVDDLARRVTAAEKRLTEGNTVGAVQSLRFALDLARDGGTVDYQLSADPRSPGAVRVRVRAERLFALAVVRRDGLVDRRRMRAGWVPDSVRAANFAWAEGVLAAARRAAPDAPEAIARHAEALARLPGRTNDALTALRELDQRDLVPDAWGYAVLARIAEARRDAATREHAIARCATLAGTHAEAVCPQRADTASR